ncbi:MAG: methyltransferase domain-containing protein, partial [Candidatus Omnitrophica bacterium]|nr:methyltransferase domain-containing protein [Candidatus Omnitrophota bacterium]
GGGNLSSEDSLFCQRCFRKYGFVGSLPLLLLQDSDWERTTTEIEGEVELAEELPVSEHIKRNRFETARTRRFLDTLNVQRGARVLDIGGSSGIGAYLFREYEAEVFIIDIVPELLFIAGKVLEGKLDHSLSVASMEWLPFLNDSFDIVFCRQAFHHSITPHNALREMFRVTREGGQILLVSEPCLPAFYKIRARLFDRPTDSEKSKSSEILKKLPDHLFAFTWNQYHKALSAFSNDYAITRQVGSAAMIATEDGLRYNPFQIQRSLLGKMTDTFLPRGMGYRGDINIRATKDRVINREQPVPDFLPADPSDFRITPHSIEQVEEQRRVFEQFFVDLPLL